MNKKTIIIVVCIFVVVLIGVKIIVSSTTSPIKETGIVLIPNDDTNWDSIKSQLTMQLLNKDKTMEYGHGYVKFPGSDISVETSFIDFKAITDYKTRKYNDCRVYYESYYYQITCDNIKSTAGVRLSEEVSIDYDLDSCRVKTKNGSCSGWFYNIK